MQLDFSLEIDFSLDVVFQLDSNWELLVPDLPFPWPDDWQLYHESLLELERLILLKLCVLLKAGYSFGVDVHQPGLFLSWSDKSHVFSAPFSDFFRSRCCGDEESLKISNFFPLIPSKYQETQLLKQMIQIGRIITGTMTCINYPLLTVCLQWFKRYTFFCLVYLPTKCFEAFVNWFDYDINSMIFINIQV